MQPPKDIGRWCVAGFARRFNKRVGPGDEVLLDAIGAIPFGPPRYGYGTGGILSWLSADFFVDENSAPEWLKVILRNAGAPAGSNTSCSGLSPANVQGAEDSESEPFDCASGFDDETDRDGDHHGACIAEVLGLDDGPIKGVLRRAGGKGAGKASRRPSSHTRARRALVREWKARRQGLSWRT